MFVIFHVVKLKIFYILILNIFVYVICKAVLDIHFYA